MTKEDYADNYLYFSATKVHLENRDFEALGGVLEEEEVLTALSTLEDILTKMRSAIDGTDGDRADALAFALKRLLSL